MPKNNKLDTIISGNDDTMTEINNDDSLYSIGSQDTTCIKSDFDNTEPQHTNTKSDFDTTSPQYTNSSNDEIELIRPIIKIEASKKNALNLPYTIKCPDVKKDELNPFIYIDNSIKYNASKNLPLKTDVLFGSMKDSGINGKNGYRSTYLIYKATLGSLAVGKDINNQWLKIGKYSLLTGLGNISFNPSSFISGQHNKILTTSTKSSVINNLFGCTIMGDTNTITDSVSSSIIASSGSSITNSVNTAIIGMKPTDSDKVVTNHNEALITRNLYALGVMSVGPLLEVSSNSIFDVNGDATIKGNLNVIGDILGERKLISTFIDAVSPTDEVVNILPDDNISIIYANPVNANIIIYLGSTDEPYFIDNKTITIKDVSVACNNTKPSYNVYIYPIYPVGMETYENNDITIQQKRGYIINTATGLVTFTYFNNETTEIKNWLITNQFIGNKRHIKCQNTHVIKNNGKVFSNTIIKIK
jgi:hypothetical protein